MPALTAVLTGNADPLAREFAKTERMAATAGRNIERGLMGGGALKSGTIREIMVLFREISYGNWSRVPGSVSILLTRLGLLKYLFSATAAVVVAAGFAVYEFWKYLKNLNEELDNTGKLLSNPLGRMSDSMRRAMVEGAEAAADFNDWLRKLGQSQETLADKTAETIRAMREEAQLRAEASGNKNPAAHRAAEQAERKAELETINKALEEQKKVEASTIKAAKDANSDAFTSRDAVGRKGRLGNIPSEMEDAKKNHEFYKDVLEKLYDTFLSRAEKGFPNYTKFSDLPEEEQKRRIKQAGNGNNAMSIQTKDGKTISISLNEAEEALRKYTKLGSTLEQEQQRLAEVQRGLSDLARDTKVSADKQKEARERLEKERRELTQSIALHEKYDPLINARGGASSHGHVSNLQQVGAYTTQHIDIARQQLHVQRQIVQVLSQKRGNMVGDFGNRFAVNYGDMA